MSDTNGMLPGFVTPSSAPGQHPLADPRVGTDDHHAELPEGKPRNVVGDIAVVSSLVGLVAVWALQESLYVIGFAISGAAFAAGAIALFVRGKKRVSALEAVIIGAVPFVFTAARLIVGF